MITAIAGLAGYLEEGGLEAEWRSALGMDIRAAVAQAPVSPDLLSPGELRRYRLLPDPERRRAWLTGRAALKRLLRRLDLASDTSGLEFPAAGLSLSHAGGIALAVACAEIGGTALSRSSRGLGVDIEADRSMRPESARFFLGPEERERISALAEGHERALLRAWTIKEAVFKSDPDNRGRLLADYRLADAAARRGSACMKNGPRVTGGFRYLSHHLAGWHISVAAQSKGMHGKG
jgi:4'-phosphopantetheinyl transferase EntD